ncbi:MAG: hypothetical protein ACPGVN_09490 [Alphaproteobacteria bacterium]
MEPFKNNFNPTMVAEMATHFQRAEPTFPVDAFIATATENFDQLELKQRSDQICAGLVQHMPSDFRQACELMVKALHPGDEVELDLISNTMNADGIRGWGIMPMCEFVAAKGLNDFDFAMEILSKLTSRFSAEFAIRHFFVKDPKRAVEISLDWCESPNHHIRRLASEGSRTRLPWGLRLTDFCDDPAPLLLILEKLKDDPEEYVRRSVANNLNDIAKDHPDVVANIAKHWLVNASPNRIRMVKHACRTLIKQGHTATLEALGYGAPKVDGVELSIETPTVVLGGKLEFTLSVTSASDETQPLLIDFIVHHKKANGGTSPKVFKWKTLEIKAGQSLKLKKAHPMNPITTRVYYAGLHGLEIQINGQSFLKQDFELELLKDDT